MKSIICLVILVCLSTFPVHQMVMGVDDRKLQDMRPPRANPKVRPGGKRQPQLIPHHHQQPKQDGPEIAKFSQPTKPFSTERKTNSSLAPDLEDPLFHSRFYSKKRSKPLNILMILADDLGFGDLSVEPFIGTGIFTPRLEKMAARGAILTNFHSASPTCTPSRASLLTGLYPWRAGIKSVFEYGERKGLSNRDDWLVQTPNAPMLFAENGYKTFHSGKWHLGGMRNDDHSMRTLAPKASVLDTNARRCPHPGPNQQGFQTYVSVLDGPGAPRQNELQVHETLYSQGCNYLLENDERIDPSKYNISGSLSYCEAKHAMRAMSDSVKEDKPFYIHLWFHAPHGPWEYIPGYDAPYPELRTPQSPHDKDLPNCNAGNKRRFRYCYMEFGGGKRKINDRGLNRMLKYYTMVSDMDAQIGMVLDHIDRLGIAKDTLILFTSDNGPEVDAGTSGGLRDRKRSIYEGGIRVPAIVQWEGTIAPGSVVNTMVSSTDMFPTFVDAAGLSLPHHYRIDGSSILPDLLAASKLSKDIRTSFHATTVTQLRTSDTHQVERLAWYHLNNIPVNRSQSVNGNPLGLPQSAHPLLFAPLQETRPLPMDVPPIVVPTNNVHPHPAAAGGSPNPRRRSLRRQLSQERLLLWHADYESPRRTAAIAYGYKLVLDEHDVPMEVFDLSVDPKEEVNLLPVPKSSPANDFWRQFVQTWPNIARPAFKGGDSSNSLHPDLQPTKSVTATISALLSSVTSGLSSGPATGSHQEAEWSRWHLFHRRQHPLVVFEVVFHLYPAMRAFATHGSDGYQAFMKQYPELRYPSTPISYERPMISNVYKTIPRERMDGFIKEFLKNNLCKVAATCDCAVPLAKDIPTLPYPQNIPNDAVASVIAVPHGYVNASVLLFDNWF